MVERFADHSCPLTVPMNLAIRERDPAAAAPAVHPGLKDQTGLHVRAPIKRLAAAAAAHDSEK
jgi:hypothetical protein